MGVVYNLAGRKKASISCEKKKTRIQKHTNKAPAKTAVKGEDVQMKCCNEHCLRKT